MTIVADVAFRPLGLGGLMNSTSQSLAELVNRDIVSVASGLTVAAAAAAAESVSWVVVTGAESQPVGLLRRAQLAQSHEQRLVVDLIRRPVIVLPSRLTVAESLRTWPFHDPEGALTKPAGVIAVTDDDEAVGVLAGPQFRAYISAAIGGTSSVDTFLPGSIGKIARFGTPCLFVEPVSHEMCTATRTFSEWPEVPIECPNPKNLAPHKFKFKL